MPLELAVDNDLPDGLKKQLTRSFLQGGTSSTQFYARLKSLYELKGLKEMTCDEIIYEWYMNYESEILKRNVTLQRLKKATDDGLMYRSGDTYAFVQKTE